MDSEESSQNHNREHNVKNIPQTIEELENWHPTILRPSLVPVAVGLFLTFLAVGFTIGYTFNALNSFNAWLGL